MTQFTKSVVEPISTKQEIHTLSVANGSGLTYTFCDRTNLASKEANYFISFNLPYEFDAFPLSDELALLKPELQQLNVDNMVIVDIDGQYYNELIDGRSVNFTVPQVAGLGISAKTVVSTTYASLEKNTTDQFLGTNISFLFSDEINLPYSGTVSGGNTSRTSVQSWINPNNDSIVAVPVATSYSELNVNTDANTDQRPVVNYAVNVGQTYPTNTNQGYNYDIPVGFVALDKGYLILTHPDIVDNIPFDQGLKRFSNDPNTGPTSATTDIYFLDTSKSAARFVDIDVNYTTSIICMVMPGEFYKTTNPSYDSIRAAEEEEAGTNGMQPVFISEIALHNSKNEILAYAKLDRPLEKSYGDFVSFTIDIKS